jgi:hypothetical protein
MVIDVEMIRLVYYSLLGKLPAPEYASNILEVLKRDKEPALAFSRLMTEISSSWEAEFFRHMKSLVPGRNFLLPDHSATIFRDVVSIGNFCHSAMALKNSGLRRFASPFDWLFSKPDMIASCIEDDFECFMDRSQYVPVPENERHDPNSNFCRHLEFQRKFGITFVFNHHRPYEEKDYLYFSRAVERFRSLLDSNHWKLFLQVNSQPSKPERNQRLLKTLRDRTSNFVLVALDFKVTNPEGEADANLGIGTTRPSHDSLHIEMTVRKPTNGVIFPTEIDNIRLKSILRSFRMDDQKGRDSIGVQVSSSANL